MILYFRLLFLSPDLFEFPADILVAARQRLVLLSKDLTQIQLVNFHASRSFLGSIDRLLPSEERLRHKCVPSHFHWDVESLDLISTLTLVLVLILVVRFRRSCCISCLALTGVLFRLDIDIGIGIQYCDLEVLRNG